MRNKSIRILFLFLALFLVFMLKSNVKAFTFTGSNGVEYNLPDLPSNGSFFSSDWYCFYLLNDSTMGMTSLIGFDPSIQCYFVTGDRIGFADLNGNVVNSNGVRRGLWMCSINGATRWDYNNPQSQSNPLSYQGIFNIDRIVYSNFDVYSASNLSTIDGVTTVSLDGIGFPRTPPLTEVATATRILTPIVEEQKVEMEKTLQEILNILPMILVVMVSYIGLRKALTMLLELLRRA